MERGNEWEIKKLSFLVDKYWVLQKVLDFILSSVIAQLDISLLWLSKIVFSYPFIINVHILLYSPFFNPLFFMCFAFDFRYTL